MKSSALITLLILAAVPRTAAAQDASASVPQPTPSISLIGLISVQPPVDDDGRRGVGGFAPGLALAIGTPRSQKFTLDGELSANWPMTSAFKSGSSSAVETSHIDTLATILTGHHKKSRNGWIEFKAGGSLVFAFRDWKPYNRAAAGRWALTGGLDQAVWTNGERTAVFSARYSYVFRDGNIGPHIVRVGIGARWGLK